MIPNTKNGLPAIGCVSAMQKFIRRGMEREAMEVAVELIHTSKAFNSMVCNRLQVISHEDIDTAANPMIVPCVKAACEQASAWYDQAKPGKSRMAIGNAIRMMCRATKSREGDHFQAAIGLANQIDGYVPQIPEWVNDGHTIAGRKQGRGVDYFRKHSTKLVPQPEKDQYEDEAYRMFKLKESGGKLL
jgi:replication-associated recombination protein RarA